MTSKLYNEIKNYIANGTYKLVRLVRQNEGQKDVEVIIPFNGVAGGVREKALARLDYIRLKLDKTLPNGKYIIQCRISPQNKDTVEQYECIVNRTIVLNNGVEDKTHEQVTEMQNIDIEEWKALVQENANLKAQLTQLQFENDFMKAHGSPKHPNLGDKAEEPKKEIWASVFEELAPSLLNMGDRFMGLQEKKLELDDKRLSSGLLRKANPKKKMVKVVKKRPQKSFEQEAQEEADYMDALPEDEFDQEMDALEHDDKELYEAVCKLLGIEDEEQDDEEEEEDEE